MSAAEPEQPPAAGKPALFTKNEAKKNSRRHRDLHAEIRTSNPLPRVTPERGIPVGLSTSSVFPLSAAETFPIARDLGYDGVEIMVTGRKATQDADHLRDLVQRFQLPILAIHAPTLLVTQRVWGGPWQKLERSAELARAVGADTVVAHPPFRWQGEYALGFAAGVRRIERAAGVAIAVENMYPWRAGVRELQVYLPSWDPVDQDYDHVTIDFSHASTAGSDVLDMIRRLGPRLGHVHLTDGAGSLKDEHLAPGEGSQPVDEALRMLAHADWHGSVVAEINTAGSGGTAGRDEKLLNALLFARHHLGQDTPEGPHR